MEPTTDRLAGLSPEKRALFEAILRKKRAEAAATATIAPRGGTEGPLPLSFSQERLWLVQQLDPESAAYNIPLVLRFTGDLRIEALRESLAAIVRRHESLRTRFETVESRPVQVIDSAGDAGLPLADLTGLPAASREAEAGRLAREEALRPFDLRQGPVFRAALLRLSAREHALVVNLHHIVSDGWSSGVFARELGLFYQAFVQGRPAGLAALPIQYADYALWQRRTLEGGVLEKQLAFWRQRLAGLDPVLELPADHPRPLRRSERGETCRFSLPEPLARDLEALSGRQKTTLFATLLAGFFALLHRQSGRDSLCVGTPVAGRRHAETEGLIGFFVNTLVLRSDRAGDPPFREHLARVHDGVLDAQAHQDVPFDRLVLDLAPERSPSHTPIFQVLFALQNAPAAPLELPGLAIRGEEIAASAAKLDLSLSMGAAAGGGLDGALEYSRDLFEEPTIVRLLNQLRTLLEGAAADPERRLSDLPLLGPAERRQILEEWNDTGEAPVSGVCLHELFAAQAARTPEAEALLDGSARVTYAELAARAGGLARWLLAHGIVPETRVAVCLDRSTDLIATLLGVLAAGGAYVPVDPAYPVERRALMLEDSGAAVLVTRGGLSADLPATGARVLDLDIESIPASDGLPFVPVLPENLAYLIYTSGSTGRPKAVAIEHRSAVALAGWARETFAAEELGGVLAATSVCFDLSVFEIFTPLAWGGRVLLAENALELPSLPYAAEVRVLNTVPSAAAELVRGGGLPPSVRTVNLAGEPLPAALAARLYATGTVERVLNLYGPSEDTTYSTGSLVVRDGGRAPAIGRPLPGTRAYVVDSAGQPVPVGVAGELWLAGAGLARGYLGRPELTAERFAPDPFSVRPGERVYRTGDLVRFRSDGEMEFLGRIDHQVKVRGFRIELGEVEAALVSHPAVEDCVCVVRDAALVAYVAGSPDLNQLRDHLGRRLPEYMVPSVFVVLDALPRTPNGKVDRKALPAPGRVRGDEETYAAPTDPTEELLAGFWGEVLGVERVGIHDNFFSLGGHSLLATQVISRVREALGVELPQREVFEAPTVAALARAVRAAREAGTVPAPPITPVAREIDLPLSFSQQRLWFLDRFEPGNPAYNIPFPVRLTGELPVELLERVFAEVVRRHEALRTTFGLREGQPVQVIAPDLPPRFALLDLSDLPADAREERARELAAEDARRPFDLESGPLLRLTLLRLAEREHVLLMTLHHIVSDGWSMGVLLREIAVLYAAFAGDRPSPLPELAVQYADFAVWQRGWLRGEVLEAQLAYWKSQLAEAPKLLEVPADRPRPLVQTYRGASRDLELAPALSAAVRELCRREGVTPFMALLAAWGVLLGRHSGQAGQEEVLVGTPVAGRNRREIEGLIGFFVNTLVLRVDLQGAPGFDALLGRVRSAALDAFQHQDLPFERIVEELVPERDLSHPPLVQVLFSLQNAPRAEVELPGLSLAPVAVDGRVARLDLTLTMQEGAEGFAAALEHNTDLFDGSTAGRLLARFEALLAAAAEAPGQSIADLPLLLPAERRQVLAEWNDTRSDYPRETSLPELFEAVAAERPEAPALVSATEVWSYRRLDEAANRLARRLQELGVGPETAVGLSLERSPELILGTLAILKAGGVYVPLDAGYPDDRLDFMLEDTGAEIVLVHETTRARFEGRRARLVSIDAVETGDATPLGANVPAESLAYVIYTSGSTGRPKGVAVPHRAVVRLVRATNYVRLGPDDRTGHVANISFDAATYEIWGALLNGGAIAIIPREVVLSPTDFARSLRELRVTSMFLTSALFTKMSREEPEAFAGLRELLVGGEAVDPSAARTVLAGRPPCRLLNGYGPTESTTFAAWHLIREVPPEAVSIPIGLPLGNTTLYVFDRRLSPVPPGVAGELFIGGDGLARGYLNRPELTAERFVPDPWEAGGRLYRTGDLVRRRADGAIEFLGRLDNQVKIRGFRIEPGEIEAVLSGHPEVRECAVLALRGADGMRLVAYVSGPARTEALRGWLQERLPDYMIPGAFVVLEALPLTPNGKVDRKALIAAGALGVTATEAQGEGYAAPRDPTEELLAGLWAEVLRLDRVGVHDDFFALGGHSLLATQVVSRIRAVLGVELPLRELFEHPTVAALAGAVRAAQQGGEAPAIVPVSRDGDLPLSFAQQRLWFLDQLEPGNPAYNVPLPVRLTGAIRVDLLERVFAEVVRRHEALRTTFDIRDGEPVQVIAPELDVPLPLLDLSHLPEGEREARARELAEADALRPFDLRTGPLLRLTLLRLALEDHILLMTLHHVVSDGWSMGVLLREIAVLHEAFAAGRPSPLPELPVQYADFAVWQRGWLQGEVLAGQLSYWRDRLAGAPAALELPTDRPRPAEQTYVGAAREMSLGPALSAAVRDLCRREGVTPFMALLAAWAVLLGRHAGQDDVLVGSPIAGRNRREIEGLIGFFVNTLVLRVALTQGLDFGSLLRQVRQTSLDAFAHQDLPFERLVEELVAERDFSRSPLFQVMLVLQNATRQEVELPGLALAPVAVEGRLAKFDLTLTLQEAADGFAAGLEHNTDLFDGGTAERLLARFAALLEAAAADPGQRVADLPLLLQAERLQVLEDWNDTGEAPVSGVCLHELFAAQVARTPEAVALVHATGRWTYAELAARAGGMARRLLGFGVVPETRVAVCLERSPDLIATLLGVLAAGGAYVPIDPAYPVERRALMLEDSGAAVLVTRGTLSADLPRTGARVLDLDTEPIQASEGLPSVPVLPENLAYLIYTSGSTGRPKAVAIEHRSAVALAGWARETFAAEDLAGVLAATSVCFDLSVFEIFTPLAWGGRILLAENALELPSLPYASEVRLLNTVPSAAAELVRGGGLPPSVRTVNLAGEPLPAVLASRLYATGTVERVLNLYGPSEDTTYSTGSLVARQERMPAIGRPLPGTRAYVVDREGQLVPPGVAGELWLAGAGLARGYLGRPELTAERFAPDPFAVRPGERVYRTGDLVRFRLDGEMEFLGRIDHQVKIRGFRIELGEVEAALVSHPAVEDCVCVVRDAALVAYLVGSVEAEALRAFLGRALPEYMVPSVFVTLEALPRTPNGKVDRKALPAPGQIRLERAFEPPRDELELRLARIWEEVLEVGPVGVRDDFFALGGHSLRAVQVAARIQSRLGRGLPLAALLRHPTVERLAALLREEGGDARREPLVELAPGEGPPLFLVHPIGGEVLAYVPLARRLAGLRAVYGLQVPDREAGAAAPSLEEMAADYLRSVRETCPEGPYVLGGWSMGGVVAFEMARQLEILGEPVERVILIDSFAPGAAGREDEIAEGTLVASFAQDLGRLLGMGGVALPSGLEDGPLEALSWLAAQAEERGLLPRGLAEAELRRRFATFRANHRALARYQGGPCAAPLLLLRAEEPAGLALLEPDRGWQRTAGRPAEVHEIPGDHYTLLQEPGVERLALVVREQLTR
jgi:amino acid adenylation domain-containing protein